MYIIRPRIIGLLAIVVVFILLVSLLQEMNRRWQVQREVSQLEREVQEMQRSVIHLQNLNQYFATDDYQERLGREKLDYRAPGEKVVLIPENVSLTQPGEPVEQSAKKLSVPEQWWRAFFMPEETT